MQGLSKAEATMRLLCVASDVWDLDETPSLHRLPLVVADPKGSVELRTADEVRSMYQGLRARFAEIGGVRMETTWTISPQATPGQFFFAETRTVVFGADDVELTRFEVSFVLSESEHVPSGAVSDVLVTQMVISGDRQTVSPLVDCPCIPSQPPSLAA